MKRFFSFLFLAVVTLSGIMAGNESSKKSIIIRLKDQIDLSSQVKQNYVGANSVEAKRKMAITSLKSFSQKSQASLLAKLNAAGLKNELSDIRQFWIANVISCKATDEVIEQLKKRADIEVLINQPAKVIENSDPAPMAAAASDISAASTQIASNIKLIRAIEANEYGYTGKGVVVGLIDTGTNYNHNDLKDALWEDGDYPNHGYDFVNEDNDPMDDNSHGTHCAGTIVGNGKSGIRTGVAPDAKLMIIKIGTKTGWSEQDVAWKGIQFAVEHGANVLSMSIGWAQSYGPDKKTWRDIMTNLLASNVLAVVAGGNEGDKLSGYPIPDNIRTPGNCPAAWLHPSQPNPGSTSSVLTIGAFKEDGITKLDMSSLGPVTWQDVKGYNDYPYNPGEGLHKPDISVQGENVYSTNMNNASGYLSMSGTSMATPATAGIVALMLSKNPSLTPAEIVQIISETSIKVTDGFVNGLGIGRADALYATLATPNPDLNCNKIIVTETTGAPNGNLNPGDEANLSFTFRNESTEDLSDYELEIISMTPEMPLTAKSGTGLPVIKAGQEVTVTDLYSIKVPTDANSKMTADIVIVIKKGDKKWTNLFRMPICIAKLSPDNKEISEVEGNDNGIPDAGEKVQVNFPILNVGSETSYNVKATLSIDQTYLSLASTSVSDATNIQDKANFSYQLNISSETPAWYRTELSLNLKGDNIDTTFIYKMDIGKTAILLIDKSKNHNSSNDLLAHLEARGNISIDTVTAMPKNLDNYHSVWYLAGVYPKNGKITEEENQTLTQYVQSGGNLYMEGGDVWYTKKNNLNSLFNVECPLDNAGELETIQGCRANYNENQSFSYDTYEQKSIDKLQHIEPAYPVYKNKTTQNGQESEFITTVFYETEKYKTIASSFEIGGILDPASNENGAVDKYLGFFGIKEGEGNYISGTKTEKFNAECYKSGDYCVIKLSLPTAVETNIRIFTAEGQLVKQLRTNISGNTVNRIPVQGLKGLYLVSIQSGDHVTVKKVLF